MTKAVSRAALILLMMCGASFGQNQQGSDQFMTQAMEMNAAEVQLGRLAQTKAQDPRVKGYAEMMMNEHGQSMDRLRSGSGGGTTSQQANNDIPLSQEHRQLQDRLSKLSGSDFDREYMNAMVNEHRKAITFFEQQSGRQNSSQNRQKPGTETANDHTSMAQQMLPTLRQHLQEAQNIQKQLRGGGKSTQRDNPQGSH